VYLGIFGVFICRTLCLLSVYEQDLMSQHLLAAFLFLMALWEAGAVLGHVGCPLHGASQLTHLIGLQGGVRVFVVHVSAHSAPWLALQVSAYVSPSIFCIAAVVSPCRWYSTFNRYHDYYRLRSVLHALFSKVSRMDLSCSLPAF